MLSYILEGILFDVNTKNEILIQIKRFSEFNYEKKKYTSFNNAGIINSIDFNCRHSSSF
jgi:hypothetical protein